MPRFYFSTEENTCRKYLCHEQPEAVFSVSQQKTDSLHLGRADGENESTALHACIVQHLTPHGWLAHGTPWSGKHSRNSRPGDPDFDTPAAYPLRAIVVIKRGETNTLRRLTPAEAAPHFFHQTYFPSTIIPDSAAENASGAEASAATVPGDSVAGQQQAFSLRLKALDLMGRLTHLPIYELHCTISQQAVTLTLGALQENIPKR